MWRCETNAGTDWYAEAVGWQHLADTPARHRLLRREGVPALPAVFSGLRDAQPINTRLVAPYHGEGFADDHEAEATGATRASYSRQKPVSR